jgi:hypothetical protein
MQSYPDGVPRAGLSTLLHHLPELSVGSDVLRAGHARGLIHDHDLVSFLLRRFESGTLAPAEEAIALLLPDEFDRIPSLLEHMAPGDIPSTRAAEIWTFVTVADIRANWDKFAAPWDEIELAIFAWGDLPEWQSLLPYMPAPKRRRNRHERRKDGPPARLDEFLSSKRGALVNGRAWS